MAGLDPETAWDRTPGELLEYISAFQDRMERYGYLLYNHAAAVASMCFSKRKPRPWEAFPGVIQPTVQEMSGDELYQVCLAWCGA